MDLHTLRSNSIAFLQTIARIYILLIDRLLRTVEKKGSKWPLDWKLVCNSSFLKLCKWKSKKHTDFTPPNIWILVENWVSNTLKILHDFAKTNEIKFITLSIENINLSWWNNTIVQIQVTFPKTIILKTNSFYAYECPNALNCTIWAWKYINTQINNIISRNSNLSCKIIKIINKSRVYFHAYLFCDE